MKYYDTIDATGGYPDKRDQQQIEGLPIPAEEMKSIECRAMLWVANYKGNLSLFDTYIQVAKAEYRMFFERRESIDLMKLVPGISAEAILQICQLNNTYVADYEKALFAAEQKIKELIETKASPELMKKAIRMRDAYNSYIHELAGELFVLRGGRERDTKEKREKTQQLAREILSEALKPFIETDLQPSSETNSLPPSPVGEVFERQEVKTIAKTACTKFSGLPSEFDEWFDQEYPHNPSRAGEASPVLRWVPVPKSDFRIGLTDMAFRNKDGRLFVTNKGNYQTIVQGEHYYEYLVEIPPIPPPEVKDNLVAQKAGEWIRMSQRFPEDWHGVEIRDNSSLEPLEKGIVDEKEGEYFLTYGGDRLKLLTEQPAHVPDTKGEIPEEKRQLPDDISEIR